MFTSAMTIQDILPYASNKSNSKKLDIDAVLPFIILPLLLIISTISRPVTIIVMTLIAMGALYAQSRPRNKNRSPFFYHWTISSGICMFVVYQLGILSLLEITDIENIVFLLLFISTCYFFYKMKSIADVELATGGSKGKEYSPVLTSDSYYCQICQIEVNERFFHSIWWNCCIFRPNYMYFLGGQVFSFATLLHGTNLGLTSVCQPFIWYGNILMPEDCNDVYYDYNLAICFVACVYGLGYLLVIALVLIRQILIYIPKYSGKFLIVAKNQVELV